MTRFPPLYRPDYEHDSCGIAAVVERSGIKSRRSVTFALEALENLAHRGAEGADPDTGDGAGILLQMPDDLFRRSCAFDLPEPGQYLSGIALVTESLESAVTQVQDAARRVGLELLGVREVPRHSEVLGLSASESEPALLQFVLLPAVPTATPDLELKGYVFRHSVPGVAFFSLSSRVFVYKGMLKPTQLRDYYPDLQSPDCISAIALVHARFSTNTAPSWQLAQPFRMVAHNGEINTIRANRNWMGAREALMASDAIVGDIAQILPVISPGLSDSASFDEVCELLALTGRSLAHVLMMMIPAAVGDGEGVSEELKGFYDYHSMIMEPWDGPAAVVCSDGTSLVAGLDRNGLRPLRYSLYRDGLAVVASETGVIAIDPAEVVEAGRLGPGRLLVIDTADGSVAHDEETKTRVANLAPWKLMAERRRVSLESLAPRELLIPLHGEIERRQLLFGYTQEATERIIVPMAQDGQEPVGSMGLDIPPASLSHLRFSLFDFFSQRFAQVTNPPLDALREKVVMSAGGTIGPEGNLLSFAGQTSRQIYLPDPVLSNEDLAKLLYINEDGNFEDLAVAVIDALFPVESRDLAGALEKLTAEAERAIESGVAVIVVSDRHADASRAPIPSLLAVSALHHHLVAKRLRTRVGLIVECGDAWEVHHFAALIGFGAAAVNPYLAFDTIVDLCRQGKVAPQPRSAQRNFIQAATKGVIKIMSKMGISTIASYTGSELFDIHGLDEELSRTYFPEAGVFFGGIGLSDIADKVLDRHSAGFSRGMRNPLAPGGIYQWERGGELHLFTPETVFLLQHATRTRQDHLFARYSARVDELSRSGGTVRGLLEWGRLSDEEVPLDEVEPASSIISRFATGAMSYGSLSAEAHETLAIAMNELGARSNSGEGGEDPARDHPDVNGQDRHSRIRQVASARFGVTIEYLAGADDVQIKISQGAKPGEGGQLPGQKVYEDIARVRHSTPGVALISPPPHHDIYSIEDLAQLIYDLRAANPRARIHVKLVSEVGVGTVAAGVAKAHADVILISSGDGGTGAAPLSSLAHAGGPWEFGLGETQQTLVWNGLRDRVIVQVDGQLKTARDIVIAALLGADEYGFATTALVVSGCIMMRACHKDTCPVGVATQDPELRKRFKGKPEFLVNFFTFLAEDVRRSLAQMGARTLDEIIGRSDLLTVREEARHFGIFDSLARLTYLGDTWPEQSRRFCRSVERTGQVEVNEVLDALGASAIATGATQSGDFVIRNTDRSVGTRASYRVARHYGARGPQAELISARFVGAGGQSFGAFLARGITLSLEGETNDYLAKGLSGGRVILIPYRFARESSRWSVIAGNVGLYGATSGELYVCGGAGERFGVRNSGAQAVVEGVGDHGCEYMTGGEVVVLGHVGRNFGAGMSGGVAYLWDPDGVAARRVNEEMVQLESLDGFGEHRVRQLVERHVELTGSLRGRRLLTQQRMGEIVTVMPRGYRAAYESSVGR